MSVTGDGEHGRATRNALCIPSHAREVNIVGPDRIQATILPESNRGPAGIHPLLGQNLVAFRSEFDRGPTKI